MKREQAFTIIELVLATAIVVTLSSIIFKSMFVFNEQRKLRTAAVELSGYLQVARNVASAANQPCTIAFTTKSGGVFEPDASKTDNACKKGTIAPAVRLGGHAGSRNLEASIDNGSGSFPLTFTPEGTVKEGVTVLLSSASVPNGAWCVDVRAPLATVRLGWQPSGGTCNYTVEQ